MGNGAALRASVLAPILDSTENTGRGFSGSLRASGPRGSLLVNALCENEKAGPVGPFAKRNAAVCRSPALEKIFAPCFQAVRPVYSPAPHSLPATLKSG